MTSYSDGMPKLARLGSLKRAQHAQFVLAKHVNEVDAAADVAGLEGRLRLASGVAEQRDRAAVRAAVVDSALERTVLEALGVVQALPER
jgi:hypothetical protein